MCCGSSHTEYSMKKRNILKVVNKDPDNLLVKWVPGGRTLTEIMKEMSHPYWLSKLRTRQCQ